MNLSDRESEVDTSRPHVFVVEIAGAGGICHYTYNLLQSFGSSIFVTLYTGCPYELEHLERAFTLKCTFRRFKTNPLRVIALCLDALRRRPMAVHFQLSQFPSLVLALMILFRVIGIRIITTAHNVISHERRGWSLWIFGNIYRLSYRIIVHSQHSKDELQCLLGLPPHKIAVIDHGNYMFFDDEESEKDCTDGIFRILFFGYIRKYKGLAVLLESLHLLGQDEHPFRLEIVGKPQESFAPYQQQIERYGLAPRVETRLDYVPLPEVKRHFQRASVVVLPYLNISQSGVLQLAYAFGKPVVVTRTGGLPEVVEDGRTGFVVPPGDSRALALALQTMMHAPELLKDMGSRAAELAETRFSWGHLGRLNQALYFEGTTA